MYTVDYFIEKFSRIPESEMGITQPDGCVYGQCSNGKGYNGDITEEGMSLTKLMSGLRNLTPSATAYWGPYVHTPARINNGDVAQYQQRTPKQRVLAALYDIKALEEKEKTVTHIPATLKQQAQDLCKVKETINPEVIEKELK